MMKLIAPIATESSHLRRGKRVREAIWILYYIYGSKSCWSSCNYCSTVVVSCCCNIKLHNEHSVNTVTLYWNNCWKLNLSLQLPLLLIVIEKKIITVKGTAIILNMLVDNLYKRYRLWLLKSVNCCTKHSNKTIEHWNNDADMQRR